MNITPKRLITIGAFLWQLAKQPQLREQLTTEEIEQLQTIAMRLEIVSSRLGKAGGLK
jgi:hypothetical protein